MAERPLHVYWCPLCEVQTERAWHTIDDGGLIPQAAVEHECERIEVVPRAEVDALRAAVERSQNDWTFIANLHPEVELEVPVRRALAVANLQLIRAAL